MLDVVIKRQLAGDFCARTEDIPFAKLRNPANLTPRDGRDGRTVVKPHDLLDGNADHASVSVDQKRLLPVKR